MNPFFTHVAVVLLFMVLRITVFVALTCPMKSQK